VGLSTSLDASEQRKSKACGENPYWVKMILNLRPSIWKSLGNKAPANQETFTISWFNA
jgi:hypothetical protein